MTVFWLAVRPSQTGRPLTCGRTFASLKIAGETLASHRNRLAAKAGLTVAASSPPDNSEGWMLRDDIWLSQDQWQWLAANNRPTRLQSASGDQLGWWGRPVATRETDALDLMTTDTDSLRIRYPWDILAIHERLLDHLEGTDHLNQSVPGLNVDGILRLGQGSRILPGVVIEGNVMIGRNCVVGPNCYLRGNTSIGDRCRIGQAVEIKNSLIMDQVAVCHLSYVGDSIVAERAVLGGGTITANRRHDGVSHRSPAGGVPIDTHREKLGAIIGPDVHTGIHTSLYPGRKLWPGVTTRPGAIVDRDIETADNSRAFDGVDSPAHHPS